MDGVAPTVSVCHPTKRVIIVDEEDVWLLPRCTRIFQGYREATSCDDVVIRKFNGVIDWFSLCPFFQSAVNVRWKLCIDPLPGGRDAGPEDEVSRQGTQK